jgi:hypothetical protein
MAKEWFDVWPTSGRDVREWTALCGSGQMRPFLTSELPGWFPSGLTRKVDGGVMVNTGSLFMVNLYRQDGADIDQQPFGFIFMSGTALASGGFIQDGNWIGRTSSLPPEALSFIAASGVGHNQFFSGQPKAVGPISALGPSDLAALAKLTGYMSGSLSLTKSN